MAQREAGRRDIIDKLETSERDAFAVVADAKKRASVARMASAGMVTSANQAKILRSRVAKNTNVAPDVPHIPLEDNHYAYEDMFVLRERYSDALSDAVRRDRDGVMRAGGYRVEEAWERALMCGVAGLDLAPPSGISVVETDVVMSAA